MCAQPSDLTEIPKVRVSSKYEAKRLTFKYSTDLFVFICITDWSAAPFPTFLDALERAHKHLSNRLSMYMGNLIGPA